MNFQHRIQSAFLLILIASSSVLSQVNNPYSRYGIGMLLDPSPSFLRGWGSLAAAYANPFSFSHANPASYAHLAVTAFHADMHAGQIFVSTSADSVNAFSDGGFSSLALAFPVKPNVVGVSMGILPFSRVSYRLLEKNSSLPGIGTSFNSFEGSGGTHTFYVGTGIRWRNFSVGINGEYLFGKLQYNTQLTLDDSLNAYNTLRSERIYLGDFLFRGGGQLRLPLDKQKTHSLTLGVSGHAGTNIRAQRNLLYARFVYTTFGGQLFEDTIVNLTQQTGSLVLPASVQAGIVWTRKGKFMIGVNYLYGQWSAYRTFNRPDLTDNSWRLSAGMQLTPNVEDLRNYWNWVAYRVGFAFGRTYLQFDTYHIPEYVLSLGVGLPARKIQSEVALALEWWRMGSLQHTNLVVTQYRFTAGVALSDRWFVKRRID